MFVARVPVAGREYPLDDVHERPRRVQRRPRAEYYLGSQRREFESQVTRDWEAVLDDLLADLNVGEEDEDEVDE